MKLKLKANRYNEEWAKHELEGFDIYINVRN